MRRVGNLVHQVAFLDDEEEEETVDEVNELLVVLTVCQFVIQIGMAQGIIAGTIATDCRLADDFHSLLHSI